MRLSAIADAVEAYWPDPETAWYLGAEHIHAHAGALNRIVVYPVGGPIAQPSLAARGHSLEPLEPQAPALPGARDDLIWERRPVVQWAVWGATDTEAEARLHCLLCCIDKALGASELAIADLSEDWIRQGDIASGGSLIVLSTTIALYVISTDIELPETPGEGVPTTAVADVTMPVYQTTDEGDELVATIVITEES